jgi:hypothetical protein
MQLGGGSEYARIDTVVCCMNVIFEMRFEALGDEKTKPVAVAELQAKTLAARLIIKSVKLVRNHK